MRHVLVASLLAGPTVAPAIAAAQPGTPDVCAARRDCGLLRLRVRAAGQRTALADTSVVVTPVTAAGEGPAWVIEATTDAAGRAAISLPPGRARVLIAAPAFERFEQVVDVRAKQTVEKQLFPRPLDANPYRTIVRSANEKRPETTARSLSREEIATMPGSQGDPLRALQALPGVARTPGGLGLLVLRGASPLQSQVFIGEHPVPRAFHALSIASVVPADVIGRMDFVPGNFDSRYGNATGGLVVIEPRRGRRDGVHGFLELDLAAASAMVEGPLKKGSFLVAAQRGYIDAVLRGAQSVTGDRGAVLPTYWDYQAMFDYPLRGSASISARVLGAGDRIRFTFDDPEQMKQRTALDFRLSFHRVDVTYRKRWNGWSAMLSPAFRVDTGRRMLPIDGSEQERRDFVTSLRAEIGSQVSKRLEVIAGADMIVDVYRAETSFSDPAGLLAPATDTVKGNETSMGVYASGRLRLGGLLLVPGFRGSGFAVDGNRAFALDPRLSGLWDISDRWRIRFGAGLYTQPRVRRFVNDAGIVPGQASVGTNKVVLPAFFGNFEPLIAYEPLADTLRVMRATQLSAGVSHDLAADITAEVTGFYRHQDNGEPPVLLDQVRRASGGRTLGLEFLLRRPLTKRLYGWLAYTLMQTQAWQDPLPGQPGLRNPGDFDQRHNLAIVASVRLPRGWQIGGRFRLVSGSPYSPVIGTLEIEGAYVPILGAYNSARFPPFHQLDLRVDKRWVYKRVSFLAYLDVLNVYNRQNVELFVYSYDYRDTQGGFGLPIFPAIGLRLDY